MPASQKADVRPLTVIGPSGECTFNVRPEDLTWTEPVRANVVQTLGSAWVDAFGPGTGQIVIAGHTGWSGGRTGPDWEQQFRTLYACAFQDWNDRVEATKDPESVEMLFADTLDDRVARVIPKTFVLRRSRSRPLLMQYHITFLVVRMLGGGGGGGAATAPQAVFDAAQDALADAAGAMDSMLGGTGIIDGLVGSVGSAALSQTRGNLDVITGGVL